MGKLFSLFPRLYILFKIKTFGIKKSFKIFKSYNIIKNNNLLDGKEYLIKYSDIKGFDPIIHYIYHGYKEGRYTINTRNINNYLSNDKKFIKSGLNPIVFAALSKNNYMTPSFDSLNLALEGKNNFFFLINDSNNEIKQHFDDFYKSNFNSKFFKDNFLFKKKFFKNENIEYYFFIFPDKSLVCKKNLPFRFKNVNRCYNKVKNLFPDFIDFLSDEDYFKQDTHISYNGGRKISFKFLNYINNNFTIEEFNRLIDQNTNSIKVKRVLDLLDNKNWSYSSNKRKNYKLSSDFFTIESSFFINLNNIIPEEFKFCRERKSHYIINKKSFSNFKVLVFGDSFFEFVESYFCLYFGEMFFYWDHGSLNKELIKWYKPDMIIELRAERFLENLSGPEWVINKIFD